MSLDASLNRIRPFTEDLYRELHAHPELSHHEYRTAGRMAALLREVGVEVHEKVGPSTGVAGIIRNGEGPVILLRADMDALPVTEAEGVDYRSINEGVMHACGHDSHMATLQAAVRVLLEHRDLWRGTVVAAFQPAEETIDGAAGMAPALKEIVPHLDLAMGQHVMPEPAGQLFCSPGPIMATSNELRITVHGRGGHGSAPERTIDPIVIASAIVMRLQTIVAREVRPADRAVVTVGTFHAGTKANIIPETATIEVNIRAFKDELAEQIIDAIERIVDGECRAAGATQHATIERGPRAPLTTNHAASTARLLASFKETFGDGLQPLEPSNGSEDFPDLPAAWGAPYVFWNFGGFDPQTFFEAQAAGTIAETIPSNHAPNFLPVLQPTLDTATKAMVTAALTFLDGPPSDLSEESADARARYVDLMENLGEM